MNHTGKSYEDMTREELERELREAFLDTDRIDEHLNHELEELREALNRRWPVEYLHTPEEAWECFLEDRAEELRPYFSPEAEAKSAAPGKKARRTRAGAVSPLLRRAVLAVVLLLLLAGAALAADSLGLVAWVPRWNAAEKRYEPAAEAAEGRPIPAALAELGITEPVYPGYLPEGFVITESHISEDPLVLMEQYARDGQRLSITVTPIKGVKTAVYQGGGGTLREYRSGAKALFLFENQGTITAVWYTKNYAATVSANLTVEELTEIIDSIEEGAAG